MITSQLTQSCPPQIASTVDFTVAIPTYNGADRLPKVLNRLKHQLHTEHFNWEIIVIDNNSQDGTARVVREYQANWGQVCSLKYVFEPEQGAAFARARAIEEAWGDWVGFLDDDNLPELDWVASAYEFGKKHPQVGAYGSKIRGLFEVEPPPNFQKIAGFLAITDRGILPHRYELATRLLPAGAGLVVRKQAWKNHVPKRLFLNHKGKEEGLASEDLEAILYIQKAGWEIWYNPQMQIDHEIPRSRFEKSYLISVARCIGLSRHHLRMIRLKTWQKPYAIVLYFVNDLRRLLTYWMKSKSLLETDVISACEWELLKSSIVSPIFLLKKQYFPKL